MNKIAVGVCVLVEMACVTALTGIALKRNNDCYKAQMECIDMRHKLIISEIETYGKDREIKELKKKLEKYENGES